MSQGCSSKTFGLLAAVALTMTACVGQVSGGGSPAAPGDEPDNPSGGRGGSPTGGTGGTAGVPVPPEESCSGQNDLVPFLGASPRLTTQQFNNSLAAMFPGLSMTPQTLPSGASKTSLFDNDAQAQIAAPVLIEQLQKSAQAVGDLVAASPAKVMTCVPANAGEEAACGRTFVQELLEKAYRRVPTGEDIAAASSFFEAMRAKYGFARAAGLLVEGVLQAPEFLYLVTSLEKAGTSTLSAFELASRLSFFLWDAPPDRELFAAARDGSLLRDETIEQQAKRMLGDARAKSAVANFQRQWLHMDLIDNIQKDADKFPGFTAGTATSMRKSLERFLAYALWDADGTMKTLLTDPTVFVDAQVAPLVGAPSPSGLSFSKYKADANQRAGLLTQPALLARLGHNSLESPILRGIFVIESLLCAPLGPPPAGVPTTLPEQETGAPPSTLRERIEQTHKGAGCVGCHKVIDGIGFGLQNYDAIGRYRTTENGKTVDARGALVGTDIDGPFNGAIELANKLSTSEQVRACVARNVYSYALSRGVSESDTCALQALAKKFADSGGNIRTLMVELVKSSAFRSYRTP